MYLAKLAKDEARRVKRRTWKKASKKRYELRQRERKRFERYAFLIWYLTHPKEVEEYKSEVVRRKVLRGRLKNHVRRARMRSGGCSKRLKVGAVDFLMGAQKGLCAVCRASIKEGFRIDHILPLALGGNNDPRNIQLLCEPCNQKKWHKHPVEFMQSRGFLI